MSNTKEIDNKKRYGGIDISLTSTAMVSVSSSCEVIDAITNLGYSIPSNSEMTEYLTRSNIIKNGVLSFIKSCDVVFIEGYSYASSGKSITQISELVGHIKHSILSEVKKDVKIAFIPPTSLKKFATGRGNAKKIDMILSSTKKGFETNDDNLADAFHLARMAMLSQFKFKQNKTEQEALLKAVKKSQKIGM